MPAKYFTLLLALALMGCESTRRTLTSLEDAHQRGTATGQVDFYGVQATVFAGEKFSPSARGQRHRLEKIGPDLYAMTEVYSASTSSVRAKSIAELGMAMHARQSGFGFVAMDMLMLKVICPNASGVLQARSHPITFVRARYARKASSGFRRVEDVLSDSAQFENDAPRQEKIDAQLHWVDQCRIINTTDASALAPTNYDYSLSIELPPKF